MGDSLSLSFSFISIPLSLFHHQHAEKMKRQKLYSNVIREQNKKTSKIPILLRKDPEGKDKKVPRMKVSVNSGKLCERGC